MENLQVITLDKDHVYPLLSLIPQYIKDSDIFQTFTSVPQGTVDHNLSICLGIKCTINMFFRLH